MTACCDREESISRTQRIGFSDVKGPVDAGIKPRGAGGSGEWNRDAWTDAAPEGEADPIAAQTPRREEAVAVNSNRGRPLEP